MTRLGNKEKSYILTPTDVDLKIIDTLSKFVTVRDKSFGLTTIISKDLFKEMVKGEIYGKLLVGKKYNDLESGIIFDILLNIEDFDNLQKIRGSGTPIVPYFSFANLDITQKRFLLLNDKCPEINKIFRGSQGSNPELYRLIKTGANSRMFTIGSYKVLD